jgi:hypothetical protein
MSDEEEHGELSISNAAKLTTETWSRRGGTDT